MSPDTQDNMLSSIPEDQSQVFIRYDQHRHNPSSTCTIIPLDLTSAQKCSKKSQHPPPSDNHPVIENTDVAKPWAPFRVRPDMEFAETVVEGLLGRKTVNKQLDGMHSNWTVGGSNVTFRTNDDLQISLEAAREYTQRVRTDISILYNLDTEMKLSFNGGMSRLTTRATRYHLISLIAIQSTGCARCFKTKPLAR